VSENLSVERRDARRTGAAAFILFVADALAGHCRPGQAGTTWRKVAVECHALNRGVLTRFLFVGKVGEPMRSTRLALIVLGVAASAVLEGAARQPVFRSGIEYVPVDVVVTDHDDRPVTDLKRDEFEIIENGRRQTIADFRFVSVPVAHRAIETNLVDPEPDVATNAAPSQNSRLFAIVIDDLHVIEPAIIPLKRVLMDFIAALSPDDDVAIVFVGRSDLSVNFTRNTTRLRAAVEHVRQAMGFGLDALAQEPDGRATALSSASGVILTRPAGTRVNYARSVAFVLKNTAMALAGSGHARRAIVYVSGGTTLQPFGGAYDPNYNQDFHDDLLDAFDAARRADVPIYTFDPRGAVTPEEAVRGGISVIHNPGIRARIAANIKLQLDYLSEVAINTGGRAFTNMSDLSRAVREIVGENGSYYLLGYYPDPLVRDGKFHELKVHVSRPGMRVRARQGYVAPLPGRAAVTAAVALDAAMRSGVNVSGLPIRIFVAPLVSGTKGVATAVTVEIAYPAPPDGSRAIDDTIDLGVIAVDPDGKIKAQSRREMKFSGTAPPSGPLTFLVDEAIDLPPQPLTLRVGVASRVLGTAGTSQMLLDVPKLSSSRLQMSGVVVGLEGSEREPTMNVALIGPLVPFQPTLARAFAADDTLRIFGRVFWKGADQPTVTLAVTGTRVSQREMATIASRDIDKGRREAVFDTMLPLKALNAPPGQYQLAVQARRRNGQTAERVIVFDLK
jgi:VWFA-related protein